MRNIGIVLREMKEDLSKWGEMPHRCIRRLSVLDSALPVWVWVWRLSVVLVRTLLLQLRRKKKAAQLKTEKLNRHFTKEDTQMANKPT